MSAKPFKPAVTTEPGLEPEAPATDRWNPTMLLAPIDRPVFLTGDPETDAFGLLAIWRTTRRKVEGFKGWQKTSYWASVLTRKQVEFEPTHWREASEVLR